MQYLQQGTTLQQGRYRIESVIGSDETTVTYKATDVEMGDVVAIKELFPKEVTVRTSGTGAVSMSESAHAERFQRLKESFKQEAVQLRRSNAVRVYEMFEENGTVYYVTDSSDGIEHEETKAAQESSADESTVMVDTSSDDESTKLASKPDVSNQDDAKAAASFATYRSSSVSYDYSKKDEGMHPLVICILLIAVIAIAAVGIIAYQDSRQQDSVIQAENVVEKQPSTIEESTTESVESTSTEPEEQPVEIEKPMGRTEALDYIRQYVRIKAMQGVTVEKGQIVSDIYMKDGTLMFDIACDEDPDPEGIYNDENEILLVRQIKRKIEQYDDKIIKACKLTGTYITWHYVIANDGGDMWSGIAPDEM